MGILLPALNKAREQGKRIVCMNNLKQLTLAWMNYASSNNDKLVNGAADTTAPGPATEAPVSLGFPAGTHGKAVLPSSPLDQWLIMHQNELPWIGNGIIVPSYKPADKYHPEMRYIDRSFMEICPKRKNLPLSGR